jgi:hypothetical protein
MITLIAIDHDAAAQVNDRVYEMKVIRWRPPLERAVGKLLPAKPFPG